MARITKHSTTRIIERTDDVDSVSQAKRIAKQAKTAGKTINHFQRYPQFFSYLQAKHGQTNTCSIRIYRGNIYIWRGKMKSLVTAHPIPNRFINEMKEVDGDGNNV